ncbi:hypothetical protein B9Z55_003649 [Caenorhabditis nigoni]|uniref:Uncharacterized protein n=1 Tax=Caenorhabditis nigoni TaxID=1611254 RepID=A0A2G5VRC6_9PELO|nr:hypothetical protein B9Z55_003649 [Caenorhabditis nigoni]
MKESEPVFSTIPSSSPPSSRRSGPSSPAPEAPNPDDLQKVRSGSKNRKSRVPIHLDGQGFYQMDNGNVASTSHGTSQEAQQKNAQDQAQRSEVYVVSRLSQPSQELLVIPSPIPSRGQAPLLAPGPMYPRFEATRWTAAPSRQTEKPQTPPQSPVAHAPEAFAEAPKMIVRAPAAPLVRATAPGPVVPAMELVAPFAVPAPEEAPAVAPAEEVQSVEENPPAPAPEAQEGPQEATSGFCSCIVYICCFKWCCKRQT